MKAWLCQGIRAWLVLLLPVLTIIGWKSLYKLLSPSGPQFPLRKMQATPPLYLVWSSMRRRKKYSAETEIRVSKWLSFLLPLSNPYYNGSQLRLLGAVRKSLLCSESPAAACHCQSTDEWFHWGSRACSSGKAASLNKQLPLLPNPDN